MAIPIDYIMRLAVAQYYGHQESIGGKGDFITAPEISQMFGEILGAWCAAESRRFGDFSLIELGAGNGTMMSDILRATRDIEDFTKHLEKIVIVENSNRLRNKQAITLAQYVDKITWINTVEELPPGDAIIVANEFLDALPIKQFQKHEGAFYELGVENGRIVRMHPANITSPDCPEGGVVETCPYAMHIVDVLKARMGGTIGIFIDYGYFTPPFQSTLQAVKNHKYHDVLESLGQADLTAHVDFKAIIERFTENGFIVDSGTQGEFLLANGISLRAEKLIASGAIVGSIQNDLNRLVDPNHMGTLFKAIKVRNINK